MVDVIDDFQMLSEADPRELARLTQTDVTRDPEQALAYGHQAFAAFMLQDETVRAVDPTLPAEIGAKMGLRSAQAGKPLDEVHDWFDFSHRQLDPEQPAHETQRVATFLLQGRTLGWLAITGRHEAAAPQLSAEASVAFAAGALTLRKLQADGVAKYHPYGVMLNRHRVTHEAIANTLPAKRVRQLAIDGLKGVLASRPENANTPNASGSRLSPKHLKFMGKQLVSQLANLPLVATMRFDNNPAIAKRRRAYAAKLLG